MNPTENIWEGRIATLFRLLFLALLLDPGGGGAVTSTSKFKVIGSTVVRAGGTTSLTCEIDPIQNYASFEWVRNGKVIPGQTNRTLSLRNVTKQDDGYYQCGPTGSATDGEERLLHVFAVGDILPDPDIEHTGVPVCGRNFALKCLFFQNYIPSGNTVYTWYKDNKEIKGQSGHMLYFTKVAETDTGAYTCTAWEGDKNTTSPRSPYFHLTPLFSPKVIINKLPLGDHVKEILGENLTLHCEVTEALPSVPDDGYTWSFSRSTDGQNRSLGGHGSSLLLGPLTTADSGRYFCEARTKTIFRLLTLSGQASVTVDVVYLTNITLTPNQEVSEDDLVILTCRVDSKPTALLAWTVNGQEVRHVTDNLDHYVIMSAACSDSNNYTCAASNPDLPGLDIHASVQLTVLCRQAPGEPRPAATALPSELEVTRSEELRWRVIACVTATLLGITVVAFLATVINMHCHKQTKVKERLPLDKSAQYSEEGTKTEQEKLLNKNIDAPFPKKEAEGKVMLQELETGNQPWAQKYGGSKGQDFKMAVPKYLIMESYGASGEPPFWPVTVEQMPVLQCKDNIIHVWGPPGSGKTLLLLDKVRWWLSRRKAVLLAVCDPSYKSLLHRLGSLALRALPKAAEKRLLLCTDVTELGEAVSQMKKHKSTKTCIAMANIDVNILTEVLQLYENHAVESLCTTGCEDISQEDVQRFRAMGGRSFHLSNSFRCTDAILNLAKEFLPSETSTANLNTLPFLSDRSPISIKVAFHPRHPAYKTKVPDCEDCQTWLRDSLSPLKDGLTTEDERWKHWVILLTGDWGSNTNATEMLQDKLKRQGVPAILYRNLNSQESSAPTSIRWSEVKPGKAAALERVEIGVDTKGHPTVYMIPGTHFSGLEKACVLVVHYDWRDDHPDLQNQAALDARLSEHRRQLHLAVTRCQTELAVLFLSPSPAAASLLKYMSGGEQNPADTIVEVEVEDTE